MGSIEPYHILPVLLHVTFLPYPNVQVISEKKLLHGIIYAIKVIICGIILPCLWKQS